MIRRPSLRTIAITLVCLLVPLTILFGILASAFYKTTNPLNTDITTSLAYLRQTMTISIVTFSVIVASVAGLIIAMYRRDKNFAQAKLPLVLLIITVVTVAGMLVTNAYTNGVQERYLRENGRPTLDEFFKAIEQQKKQ